MSAFHIYAHAGGKQDFVYVIQLILLLIIQWDRYDFHFHFLEERPEDKRD